jgi:carboxyl-terminal processing protease
MPSLLLIYSNLVGFNLRIKYYDTLLKKKYHPVAASLFFVCWCQFQKTTFEIAKQIEIFTTLFKELNTNVDETNPGELMDKAITGMLSSLDPILLFYNEQEVVNFKINNTGEYTGIGALITRKEGKLIIRESTKISPDKAGFKAGDEIIKW